MSLSQEAHAFTRYGEVRLEVGQSAFGRLNDDLIRCRAAQTIQDVHLLGNTDFSLSDVALGHC